MNTYSRPVAASDLPTRLRMSRGEDCVSSLTLAVGPSASAALFLFRSIGNWEGAALCRQLCRRQWAGPVVRSAAGRPFRFDQAVGGG